MSELYILLAKFEPFLGGDMLNLASVLEEGFIQSKPPIGGDEISEELDHGYALKIDDNCFERLWEHEIKDKIHVTVFTQKNYSRIEMVKQIHISSYYIDDNSILRYEDCGITYMADIR